MLLLEFFLISNKQILLKMLFLCLQKRNIISFFSQREMKYFKWIWGKGKKYITDVFPKLSKNIHLFKMSHVMNFSYFRNEYLEKATLRWSLRIWFCLFCSLYSLRLEQDLAHSRCSISIWCMIDWINDWKPN